jgi:hypothetical protein
MSDLIERLRRAIEFDDEDALVLLEREADRANDCEVLHAILEHRGIPLLQIRWNSLRGHVSACPVCERKSKDILHRILAKWGPLLEGFPDIYPKYREVSWPEIRRVGPRITSTIPRVELTRTQEMHYFRTDMPEPAGPSETIKQKRARSKRSFQRFLDSKRESWRKK